MYTLFGTVHHILTCSIPLVSLARLGAVAAAVRDRDVAAMRPTIIPVSKMLDWIAELVLLLLIVSTAASAAASISAATGILLSLRLLVCW